MIDTKELRRLANRYIGITVSSPVSPQGLIEILDRLEAAEKERDEFKRACFGHISDNSMLRTKIEAMEKQAPVGWLLDGDFYEVRQMSLYKDNEPLPGQTALYALPGAQPAPSVRPAALYPVISWLRNGCDPMKAADELEMLAAAPEAKP